MRIKACFILFLFFGAFGVFADSESAYVSTVNGVSNAVPKGYVPPLVSNGSLCMLVDYQGGANAAQLCQHDADCFLGRAPLWTAQGSAHSFRPF